MSKNLVILSDGTGNSAAKANKTNVWRLYQALETTDPTRQVVMYDDGVGSQSDTRWAAICGAFGFGLQRNVTEMYEFVCRNYRPGDRIYLFGFSRGAFTVRLLAGLMLKRGVLKVPTRISHKALNRRARFELKQFRKTYNEAFLSTIFSKWIYGDDDRDYEKWADPPGVKFLGVWDTVDAYGLPIDEMAILWNRFISQLRFDDQNLHYKVERACQALSIGDERLTFHPLVWNEDLKVGSFDPETSPTDIRQVWFSGAHADVGGGYPEPELALVSLDWMIMQATDGADHDGLRFVNSELNAIREQANPHGKQHNSRKGVKALYRYKPRYIERLSNDPDGAQVLVSTPKIHQSVFERIERDVVPYAPFVLPENYEIVTTDGSPPPDYAFDNERKDRFIRQERARDAVFWGRSVYNSFLIALAAFVILPLCLHVPEGRPPAWYDRYVGWAIDGLNMLLPGIVETWLTSLRAHPEVFLGFVGIFVLLFFLSRYWGDRIRGLANAAWIRSGPPPTPDETNNFTRKLRRWLPKKINRIIYMSILAIVPVFAILHWGF